MQSYTARCGRTDTHHAHLFVNERGSMAPCVGNDQPRITEHPAEPEWLRRQREGRLPAKDYTRA